MARYGRIIHEHKDGGSNTNYMKFETVAIRRDFQQAFLDHHSSHDHDGPVPVYEDITRGDMQSYQLHQAEQRQWPDPRLTIDGYLAHEIYEYHTLTGFQNGTPRYQPPTSCISPLIVLYTDTVGMSGDLVDSGTLERHELSSDFLDMSDDEFKSMFASVADNGFFDPLIRIHEGKILDGWHRYRVALELNIVRKLRFTVWDIEEEGTPEDFVIARNLHRRHLEPGRRAQILIKINTRLERGNVKAQQEQDSDPSRDEPKTRTELAKEANVGTATIDRAIQVEKAGRSEEVIAGEKTAGEVITEETIKDLWEQITPAISAWKAERDGVGYASKTMFIHAALRYEGHPSDTKTTPEVLKSLLGMLTENPNFLEKLIRKQLDGNSLWAEFEEDEDPDALDVEAEVEKTGRAQEVISGKKTAGEVLREELEKQQAIAQEAEDAMWEAFNDSQYSQFFYKEDLWEAAAQHFNCATEYPDCLDMKKPDEWTNRFRSVKIAIESKAQWLEDFCKKKQAYNRALTNADSALSSMWNTFEDRYMDDGITKEDFAVAAAHAHGWQKINELTGNPEYESFENFMLEEDFALLKNQSTGDLKKFSKRFRMIQDEMFERDDIPWIKELLPDDVETPETTDPEFTLTTDDLHALPLEDIFEHVRDRVVYIPVEDENAVMADMAQLLGKASKGMVGTQMHLLMKFALFISPKRDVEGMEIEKSAD